MVLPCVCVLSAERERDTSPSGFYMNHVHYIIERERERCYNWDQPIHQSHLILCGNISKINLLIPTRIHLFNTFQRKIQLMLQRQPRTSNLPSHSFIAPQNPPLLCGKDIWHISQPSVQIIRVYLGEGTLTSEGLRERKQAPV